MILLIKILVLLTLGGIAYQDIKDQLVWWWLFPLLGVFSGYLFYSHTTPSFYLYAILFNLISYGVLLGVVFAFSRIVLKTSFLNNVLGLGDVLFLLGCCVSFSPYSFLILLICGMLFSLVMGHFFQKHFINSVPLAGLFSVLLIVIYPLYWLGVYPNLYQL